MTVRRPKQDAATSEVTGDVSSPINMSVSPSGDIVLPPNLNVQNVPLVTADILFGGYLPTFDFRPSYVNGIGLGTVTAWHTSGWTCTVAGTSQWRFRLTSPFPGAGLNGGTDVIDVLLPFQTYAAGETFAVIGFASASWLASILVASPPDWLAFINKSGGTGTFVPGVLGVGSGNLVVMTSG